MGCDIHWYSETRINGVWVSDTADTRCVEEPDTEDSYVTLENFPNRKRDYWLFGLLSDVRTNWPWSFSPKGMPDDASEPVKEQCHSDGSDGHSHSYLDRAELKDKLEELRRARVEALVGATTINKEAAPHLFLRVEEIVAGLNAPVPDTDQRLVFWFDN